jgi:hypothetical protein
VLSAVAAIASLIEPQWIERISRFSPDEGSGEPEWLITAVLW